MTNVQIEGGTLFANQHDRIVSGLLLPYGEIGRTNLGRFSCDPGVITVPQDVTVLAANTDHDREHPVARFMTAVDTAAGVVASFLVGNNPEGDALLAEIADVNNKKARRNLSAEIRNVVIKAGKATGGTLFGAAFVEAGAFPSATLLAADVGEDEEIEDTPPADPKPEGEPTTTVEKFTDEFTDEDGVKHTRTTTTTTKVEGSTTTITTATVIEEPEGDPEVGNNLPNTLTAGKSGSKSAPKASDGLSLAELGRMLFAARMGDADPDAIAKLSKNNGATLFGALSDVKFDGTGGLAPTMMQPQWIGEVWNALVYKQMVLPLFAHADLTAMTWQGFRWGVKPKGGDWTGNKTDVPSNVLTVTPATGTADRYAIGHDIAREFEDFNVEGFFESYAKAVTEDYAAWADTKVTTKIIAGATAIAGDALTTLPGVAGGTIGSAASAIIDGVAAITPTGTMPDFALVATGLWKQMAKMPASNVLGYLNAALGFKDGELDGFKIIPSAAVAAGKVLVGARQAATVYELPGAPIRIDALDLARGGIDKAAFGYVGVNINDARALQLVTAATA